MSVSNQDVLCLHWTSGEYYRGCPGRSCVEYFGHCTYHGLCPQPMVCVDGCRGPMGARTVPSPSSGTPSERRIKVWQGATSWFAEASCNNCGRTLVDVMAETEELVRTKLAQRLEKLDARPDA
jgi:hypothetical protein